MNKNKIALYVRISEEDLEKTKEVSSSIYNQINLIKSYAIKQNFIIEKEYIDDGYSGGNFNRPGFTELLNDIEKGIISTVITKDISRLGRDFIETSYYIFDFFPKHNIRYIAINDYYDSYEQSNVLDETMILIKNIINDRYIYDSSIKRKQISEIKTKNGEFIGFIAPYGYKVVKKNNKRTLEIDEYSSLIIKKIFTNIACGKTRKEVAEELNKEKVLPPIMYMNMTPNTNKKYYYEWSDKIIYRILKNETYMGNTIIRKSEKINYKQKKRKVVNIKDRKVIKNTHPAIINEALFQEANSKIINYKRKNKNNYNGILKDLVICGVCNRPMTPCRISKKEGIVKYYFACTKTINRKKCSNRIIYNNKLENIIEKNVKKHIETFINKKIIINKITKELFNKEKWKQKETKIKKEIDICNIKIKDLYIQKIKEKINFETFMNLKIEQQEMIKIYQKELIDIQKNKNIKKLKYEVSQIYDNFINCNILFKKIIYELIEQVIINSNNKIKIIYKFRCNN